MLSNLINYIYHFACHDKDESNIIKPWEKKKQSFELSDVDGVLNITMANQIYIDTQNVKPRLQNQTRRMASFSNPEFYKNQAMGFGNRDEDIVWYGSMNLLSGEKEGDNLMRVVSREIALELMEISFQKEVKD